MNNIVFNGLDITDAKEPVSVPHRASVASPGTSSLLFSTPSPLASGGSRGGKVGSGAICDFPRGKERTES
jgi:hypothetical protein